jgi:hypothetical protein
MFSRQLDDGARYSWPASTTKGPARGWTVLPGRMPIGPGWQPGSAAGPALSGKGGCGAAGPASVRDATLSAEAGSKGQLLAPIVTTGAGPQNLIPHDRAGPGQPNSVLLARA